jgi:hypothetical protein
LFEPLAGCRLFNSANDTSRIKKACEKPPKH